MCLRYSRSYWWYDRAVDTAAGCRDLRNWFEFAIPTLTGGTLTSATLNLDDSGHIGDDLTFSVYGLSNRPLAFNDVTGNPYGSVTTTDASTGTTITITLNAAALAAIGAQQGGDIFIGGIDSGENDSPCAANSSSVESTCGSV